MEEIIKLIIGAVFLILGFPIGLLLAKLTKEEISSGQKWFRLICILGCIGGAIALILGNDVLMFSLFFIAIVASASLKN